MRPWQNPSNSTTESPGTGQFGAKTGFAQQSVSAHRTAARPSFGSGPRFSSKLYYTDDGGREALNQPPEAPGPGAYSPVGAARAKSEATVKFGSATRGQARRVFISERHTASDIRVVEGPSPADYIVPRPVGADRRTWSKHTQVIGGQDKYPKVVDDGPGPQSSHNVVSVDSMAAKLKRTARRINPKRRSTFGRSPRKADVVRVATTELGIGPGAYNDDVSSFGAQPSKGTSKPQAHFGTSGREHPFLGLGVGGAKVFGTTSQYWQ